MPKEVSYLALTLITDLKQVPLGPIARDFVLGYDHNPDEHVEFLISLFWETTHGPFFGSWDELAAYCRGKRLLRQYPSRVWNREKACAYVDYLDMVVGWLRGKREQPLITTTLAPDMHRSAWLRSEELRTAVTHLQEELDRTVFWFNISMVALWLTWVDSYRMEWPEMLKELTPEDVRHQANQLDDLCYGHGTRLLSGCSRPYQLIVSLEDVPCDTRNLFLLTPNQIQEEARLRVGAGPKEPDKAIVAEMALEEPDSSEEPQERRTPGGILLR